MSYRPQIKTFSDYKSAISGPLAIMDSDPKNDPNSYKWRVLAEGDSWFNINRLWDFNENLLNGLRFNETTYIVNMALAGDNAQQMGDASEKGLFNKDRVIAFNEAVLDEAWDFFLISAGGNDLIDAFVGKYKIDNNKEVTLLKECRNPTSFMDFINIADLNEVLEYIFNCYGLLINTLRKNPINKNKKIIGHTYDYFTLRNCKKNKDKSNRQKALEKFKVPVTYWKQITALMNDRLAETLLRFNNNPIYPNVFVANTLGSLVQADEEKEGNTKHWRNEIHPNKTGYKKIGNDRLNTHLFP